MTGGEPRHPRTHPESERGSRRRKGYIDVWRTGRASRESLFVRDAAEGIVRATESYDGGEPVNLGSGVEITIRNLAELICLLCDCPGEIRWDNHPARRAAASVLGREWRRDGLRLPGHDRIRGWVAGNDSLV